MLRANAKLSLLVTSLPSAYRAAAIARALTVSADFCSRNVPTLTGQKRDSGRRIQSFAPTSF